MQTITKIYIGISIIAFLTKREKLCGLIPDSDVRKICQVFAQD